MKLIPVHLPQDYIVKLDKLVAQGFYPSRSDAIRFAIHDLIRDKGTLKPYYYKDVRKAKHE